MIFNLVDLANEKIAIDAYNEIIVKAKENHNHPIMDAAYELAHKKRSDYTGGRSVFFNFDMTAHIADTDAIQNYAFYLANKAARQFTIQNGKPNFESSIDTAKDMINYINLSLARILALKNGWRPENIDFYSELDSTNLIDFIVLRTYEFNTLLYYMTYNLEDVESWNLLNQMGQEIIEKNLELIEQSTEKTVW